MARNPATTSMKGGIENNRLAKTRIAISTNTTSRESNIKQNQTNLINVN